MKIYGDKRSGNCYKLELLTSILELQHEWIDVDILKGEINSSVMTYTSSALHFHAPGPVYKIPQINMSDPTYEKIVGFTSPGPQPLIHNRTPRSVTTHGETYLEVREDFILLEINEENVVFQKENFEIELFEITRLRNKTTLELDDEILIPLRFAGPTQNTGTTRHVDYFFDLDVDLEISTDVLCEYKGVETAKGLFIQRQFALDDCRPSTAGGPTDQYRTLLSDIGEVCD